MSENQKELFTVPQFIERYAISRTSLYEEAKRGRLRLLKRGRRTLIERQAAEDWLDSLRKASQEVA